MLDSDTLYIAGPYSQIAQSANVFNRRGLARISASGSGVIDAAWNPQVGFNGTSEIAFSGDGRMFATPFMFDGSPSNIDAVSLAGSGATDPSWQVITDIGAGRLVRAGNTLYVGGNFTSISGEPRRGLAALPIDGLFGNGFEGQ